MYLAIIACHLAFILIKFWVKKKMNAQVKIDFHLTSIFMVKLFLALLLITLIKIRGLNTWQRCFPWLLSASQMNSPSPQEHSTHPWNSTIIYYFLIIPIGHTDSSNYPNCDIDSSLQKPFANVIGRNLYCCFMSCCEGEIDSWNILIILHTVWEREWSFSILLYNRSSKPKLQ